MKVLVTGAAGFIGFHVVKRLAERGFEVTGIDNLNTYYDVDLKYARLAECGIDKDKLADNVGVQSDLYPCYQFQKTDLVDMAALTALFDRNGYEVVVNLAAQAGVRYSIEHPATYIQSNVVGFLNVLECCRYHKVKHLVYASSSSVYGMNEKYPFSEDDVADCPVSLYAATKRSDELMAYTYSHLYQLPVTGLRFFTVYGPWGRPDMSPMLFADAILNGRAIKVFNNGDMMRDFTYIDDIVDGVCSVLAVPPGKEEKYPYYRLLNIGNADPVPLMDFIRTMERTLGVEARLEMTPMQEGDVKVTYADVTKLKSLVGYQPHTSLAEGLGIFVAWYKKFYLVRH
ncbi:NAD-dependent epimerase/dehydratase family protein [uncultured Bacteroides sp.]|uniref:NAD-dependent epimerase/dehydratase family protein n=1 Tax=uncultured Bacteroides sp. TaxID=162156 RepID=UPI002AAAF0FD|nr:NAD-dependent epimerase/dehydratase family protein [uncultured Bacteroides sp.]